MDGASVLNEIAAISRRQFMAHGLTVAGWGAFATVLGTGAIETVNFFFPRVRFQPPTTFRVGLPEDFFGDPGSADAYGIVLVDDRWKSAARFFVVRERERIYALSARCAHLGCSINWFSDLRTFRCPCHGSEYHSNGVPFAGPAPRALDRFRIDLSSDGQLIVDTGIIYGPDRYTVDGASITV